MSNETKFKIGTENDPRAQQIILDSQEKIHQYRKFQDCYKALTFESLAINDAIIEINKSIYDIKKRQIILAKKK